MKNIIWLLAILFAFNATYGQQNIDRNGYYGEKEIAASTSIILKPGFFVPTGSDLRIFIGNPSLPAAAPLTYTPTSTLNYVTVYNAKVPGIKNESDFLNKTVDEATLAIEYLDGFLRPIQSIVSRGSVHKNDVVHSFEYDQFGRQSRSYLPYESNNAGGNFKSDALTPNLGVYSFYNNPQQGNLVNPYPFSESKNDGSPLNRIVEQSAPGSAWQLNQGHTVKRDYFSNNDEIFYSFNTQGSKRVALYTAHSANGGVSITRLNGTAIYASNELYVIVAKNENWKAGDGCLGTTEEYYDKVGRTVLKRSYNLLSNGQTEMLSTYYVYDQFGNLCFVLPPNFEADNDNSLTQPKTNELSYQYVYDHKKRLIEKKLPGKGWEFIVYNLKDQAVLSQDAVQRNKTPQQWSFAKHDNNGRNVITGIYQFDGSTADASASNPNRNVRTALQTLVNSHPLLYEIKDGVQTHGYTNQAFPVTGILNYLSVNYYDDYNIPGLPPAYNLSKTYSDRVLGLPVAAKVAVLNNPSHMLWSVSYYNDRDEVVKTIQQHYKGSTVAPGNYNEYASVLNFEGRLLNQTKKHVVDGNSALTVQDSYEYNHTGLLDQIKESINDGNSTILSKYAYNALGQLVTKKNHSENNGTSFLHETNYQYNERGWPLQASGDLFKYKLNYQVPINNGVALYNGNISSQTWGTTDINASAVNYLYDHQNRLLSGIGGGMQEKDISYDKIGNIKSLTRDGNVIAYDYDQNGLSANNLINVSGNGLHEQLFLYDLNGNTIKDGSKNNINITYNISNQPQSISGSQSITYTYNAYGTMLSKVSSSTGTKEYVDFVQYGNNSGNYGIDIIKTNEGRALRQSDGSYRYQYDLIDHLGNTRLTFDKDPITGTARRIQQDDYYPFGKRKSISPVSLDNNYLYNGKELQEELDEYDYSARFYNPEIARWNVIDPHAETYFNLSPYSYVGNNPVIFTDPTGMDINPWIIPRGGLQRDAVWWDNNDPSSIPKNWEILGDENYSFSGGDLNDVEVFGKTPDWVKKKRAAFEEMYEKKKKTLGWFDTSPNTERLLQETAAEFHERYFAHNEIDPFTGKPRVIGLVDANWIIDIGVSVLPGLVKSVGAIGAAKAGTKLLSQFTSTTLDDAAALTMKQKGAHIFANKLHPKPYLDQLANQVGGRQSLVRSALDAGNGRFPSSGIFEFPVNVAGQNLTIRGFVNNGQPIINTMFK